MIHTLNVFDFNYETDRTSSYWNKNEKHNHWYNKTGKACVWDNKKTFQVDVDVVLKVLLWNNGEGKQCSIWIVLFLLTNLRTHPGHWVEISIGLVTPAGLVVQLIQYKLANYFSHQKLKSFPASNITTRTKFQSVLKMTPGRSQKSSVDNFFGYLFCLRWTGLCQWRQVWECFADRDGVIKRWALPGASHTVGKQSGQ